MSFKHGNPIVNNLSELIDEELSLKEHVENLLGIILEIFTLYDCLSTSVQAWLNFLSLDVRVNAASAKTVSFI